MKLVFITPGMTFGGAERVISILANIWCDMGHEVSIFITATDRPPVYKLNDKINVEHYSNFNENGVSHFKLISSIRSFVNKEKPDCVISFINDVCAYTIIAVSTKNGSGTIFMSRSVLGSSIHKSLLKNISWKMIKYFVKLLSLVRLILFSKQKVQNNATQRKYKENQVLF